MPPALEAALSAIIAVMIFVTGGTGFIGQALLRQLVASGQPVRSLIRPSVHTPQLPHGIPIEVAVCSLKDERGLRAALKGVDVVYHLAGSERRGGRADLMDVDIQGTRSMAHACAEAGVKRFFYLSRLGADRASAYPVLKAKAIAENYIRQSGIPYTILRSASAFGAGDWFTNGLARMARAIPMVFLLPGDGSTLLQPIWVEDLTTCLVWALDDPATINQTYSIGGPESIPFKEILRMVLDTAGIKRMFMPFNPAYLRTGTVLFESGNPAYPLSIFWLDELAADRTCALDTVPRVFGLMPARFSQHLQHLQGIPWKDLRKAQARRRARHA